jgi:hypothetical protein
VAGRGHAVKELAVHRVGWIPLPGGVESETSRNCQTQESQVGPAMPDAAPMARETLICSAWNSGCHGEEHGFPLDLGAVSVEFPPFSLRSSCSPTILFRLASWNGDPIQESIHFHVLLSYFQQHPCSKSFLETCFLMISAST